MESITVDLNGEPQHDIALLKAACEKYKDALFGKEIVRACGRMMYEVPPENKRSDFERILENYAMASEETLNEIEFNLQRGNTKHALEIALPYAEKMQTIEQGGVCLEDSESVYYDFLEPAQELLWVARNQTTKTVRKAVEPFSKVYLVAASALYESERYDEAIVWLERAIRWNPASPALYLELCENYKCKGEFEQAE